MNLLQLKYFQVTASLQHMGKASQQLRVSQPYLSKTISSLEKELNVKLFDRKGKSIVLNESGKIFLDAVNNCFLSLDKAILDIQSISEDKNKELTILAVSCSYVLPKLLTSFKIQYPDIKFKIFQNIEPNKTSEDYDLCIFSSNENIPTSNKVTLLEEEIVLALPITHPLSNLKDAYLSNFIDDEFISLEKTKAFRKIVDNLCENINFHPNIGLECDSPSTLRSFIKNGDGIAFVPKITWGIKSNNFIKVVHIKNCNCYRYINLSWTEGKEHNESLEQFKEFIQSFFKKLNDNYVE
ncbi:LysR family transcriptional regulator [Intestinibacter sp.]